MGNALIVLRFDSEFFKKHMKKEVIFSKYNIVHQYTKKQLSESTFRQKYMEVIKYQYVYAIIYIAKKL